MKKYNYIAIVAVFCCCLFGCFSLRSSGVSAKWFYGPSGPVEAVVYSSTISHLIWVGSEELPNEEETGHAHKTLIDNILNGIAYDSNGNVIGVGLNTQNSYLGGEISDRKGIWWRNADQLGSMDIWEDDTINNYFDLNEATNAVSFILEFPDGSDDTYYLYTTSVDLGGRSSPNITIGDNVYPIYRTTITKNEEGKWIASITEKGYAPSAYYANPILGLAIDPAFNTDKWTAGELGASRTNAIPAFVGQSVDVEASSSTTSVYYKILPTSNQTITVSVTSGDNATVSVLNSNGRQINVTGGAQNSKTVKFSASANNTYYIVITGEELAKFTITKT